MTAPTRDPLRVVIADDDPLQLKLAGLRLARLGFDVEAVDNGRAAVEAESALRVLILPRGVGEEYRAALDAESAQEAYDRLKAEHDELTTVGRVDIARKIEAAREKKSQELSPDVPTRLERARVGQQFWYARRPKVTIVGNDGERSALTPAVRMALENQGFDVAVLEGDARGARLGDPGPPQPALGAHRHARGLPHRARRRRART